MSAELLTLNPLIFSVTHFCKGNDATFFIGGSRNINIWNLFFVTIQFLHKILFHVLQFGDGGGAVGEPEVHVWLPQFCEKESALPSSPLHTQIPAETDLSSAIPGNLRLERLLFNFPREETSNLFWVTEEGFGRKGAFLRLPGVQEGPQGLALS